jgi:hypothetical protein
MVRMISNSSAPKNAAVLMHPPDGHELTTDASIGHLGSTWPIDSAANAAGDRQAAEMVNSGNSRVTKCEILTRISLSRWRAAGCH